MKRGICFINLIIIILISSLVSSQLWTNEEAKINFNPEDKKFELEFFDENGHPASEKDLNYEFKREKAGFFKKEETFTIKNTKENFEIKIKDFEPLFKELKAININSDKGQKYLTLKLNKDLNSGFKNNDELQIPLFDNEKIRVGHFGEDGINIQIELPKGKIRTVFGGMLRTEQLSEKEEIKFPTIPLNYIIYFSDKIGKLNNQKTIEDLFTKPTEKDKFLLDLSGRSYIQSFGFKLSRSNGAYLFFDSSKTIKDIDFKIKPKEGKPKDDKYPILNNIKFPQKTFGNLLTLETSNIIIPLYIPKGTKLFTKGTDINLFSNEGYFFLTKDIETKSLFNQMKEKLTSLKNS